MKMQIFSKIQDRPQILLKVTEGDFYIEVA